MNTLYVGGLSARLEGPHVYFIRVRDLLYVGETQKHPVIRWSGHLGPQGSFREAVLARGLLELDFNDQISFYAYQLSELTSGVPEVQIKQATQAVEHELHALLRARPSLLGRVFRIISDTQNTAPRTFKQWAMAQRIAETIARELASALAAGFAA
jgi:hypothetical protein